jgi:hypothetical protein
MGTRQRAVYVGLRRRTQSYCAPSCKSEQPGRDGGIGQSLTWWRYFGDHLSPIGHEYALARAHLAKERAQPILELTNAYGVHAVIVAS